MKRNLAALACGLCVLLAVAGANGDTFDWNGLDDANYLDAANWNPAGFTNIAADDCHVNSGDKAKAINSTAFNGTLTVHSGGQLAVGGYVHTTVADLHLDGGHLFMVNDDSISGAMTVDDNSTFLSDGGGGCEIDSSISGSGNLEVEVDGGQTCRFRGDKSGYSGNWTFKGAGSKQVTNSLGSGTVTFLSGNAQIGVNTSCEWFLNTGGGEVAITYTYSANTHTGTFHLLSDAVLNAATDGYGKKGTINGLVTGSGMLTTKARVAVVLGGANNDYSGGTRVNTAVLEANAAGSLGTGSVQVDPGATLEVAVSDTTSSAADLYLDSDGGGTYATLDLGGTGVVTTVAAAYTGGLGGWAAPAGYSQLAPGDYTAADLPNYLAGDGTLTVLPEPATLALLALGGAALLRTRRRKRSAR